MSYQRRLLHGKIDILRAELVARLQTSGGRSVLDQVDVDRLTEILTGKSSPPALADERRLLPGVRLPEPGVGELLLALRRAPLAKGEPAVETTQTFSPDEVGEHRARALGARGPGARRALGRRQGGGELHARRASGRASAARPTARSSSTTSPSRATTPCSSNGTASSSSRTRARSTARSSTASRIDSAPLDEGRRAPDRQVPDDVHRMTSTAKQPEQLPQKPARERFLRIGEVVRRLRDEFPDISISKIRYLEDEGLLMPAAHAGRLPAVQRGTTSSACRRSCACSATSSCRCA